MYGKWRGSGIYDFERIENVSCENEDDETGIICTFEGDLDVLYADNGYRIWTCPSCGYEHYDSYDSTDLGD